MRGIRNREHTDVQIGEKQFFFLLGHLGHETGSFEEMRCLGTEASFSIPLNLLVIPH